MFFPMEPKQTVLARENLRLAYGPHQPAGPGMAFSCPLLPEERACKGAHHELGWGAAEKTEKWQSFTHAKQEKEGKGKKTESQARDGKKVLAPR